MRVRSATWSGSTTSGSDILFTSGPHPERPRIARLSAVLRTAVKLWKRLRILLEVHAKAEENLFYPRLLKLQQDLIAQESPGEETEDAVHDHNEIRDAIAAVDRYPVGATEWLRAIAQVNEVNSDHMAEEERQGLTDFRRHVDREERHAIAVSFAAFEAEHADGVTPRDVDPKAYVRDND